MPPRYAYWTILIDRKPTAFRARERDELLPTLHQLRRTNADVIMMWFARGRLWESPEAELAARMASRRAPKEKRGPEWRPGGAHADPRARFKKGAPRPERPRGPWKADGDRRPERPGGLSNAGGDRRPEHPGGPWKKAGDHRQERPSGPWKKDGDRRPDRPRGPWKKDGEPRADRPRGPWKAGGSRPPGRPSGPRGSRGPRGPWKKGGGGTRG